MDCVVALVGCGCGRADARVHVRTDPLPAQHDRTVAGDRCGPILVVGLALAVSSPGRKRLARAAVGLALAIGILFVAAHLRTTSDPLVGDWTATADNLSPTPVTITASALGYTLRSRAPARIGDSSCELPAGTVLGTLTGTAPTYHGQQLVASPGDCNWTGWEPMVLTSDGTTLHGRCPAATTSCSPGRADGHLP